MNTKKECFSVYMERDIKEELDLYCFLANRNRVVVIRAALKEYLNDRLPKTIGDKTDAVK